MIASASMRNSTLAFVAGLIAFGCGSASASSHADTLARLRNYMNAPVGDSDAMQAHNDAVREAVESGALEGLRTYEVEERIGRGEECGMNEVCTRRDFLSNDWLYYVGRNPSDLALPAGPALIIGFDRTGIVDRTYFVVRER